MRRPRWVARPAYYDASVQWRAAVSLPGAGALALVVFGSEAGFWIARAGIVVGIVGCLLASIISPPRRRPGRQLPLRRAASTIALALITVEAPIGAVLSADQALQSDGTARIAWALCAFGLAAVFRVVVAHPRPKR